MLKWERPPSKYRFYFLLRKWIYLGSKYNKSWPAANKISVLLTKRQDPQKLGVFRFEVFCTTEAKFPVRSWTDFANFIDNLISTVPKKLYKLCKKHIYYGPEKNFANFINKIFNTRVKKKYSPLETDKLSFTVYLRHWICK